MIKSIGAALVAVALLTGCGFEDDATELRDIILEVCKREGGQLMLGASVSVWGTSSLNIACVYPEGKFPKHELKK